MGGLQLTITTDVKSTLEALGRVQRKATDLEKGVLKVSKTLTDFGSMASKGLTVPIAGAATALGLLTKQAIDFRTKMREVQTLLPKLTDEGFEDLNKKALELSKNIGIMPDKVVPALYQAISAGIPQENVFKFLETSGKLAIGGVTSLETSVDGLTSVVNAYGNKVIDVEKASDIMFTTVKLGKTNAEELSKSLFNVIPTAASAGVKFEEIGAALALMTSQGVPTSVATTQLRQTIVELNKSSSVTAKTFNELTGKSFKDFIQSGGSLQQALQILEKEANKNGKTIADMFSSVEAGNAALSLTGANALGFTKNLKEMEKSAGATDKAFDTMELDEGRQFERLKVEINALMTELGSKLIPVVRGELLPLIKDDIMPIAKSLIEKTGELFSKFNKMSPAVKTGSLAFVALLAAVGPAMMAIGAGIKTVVAMKAAWLALNSAMLVTPIGMVATVVAAIAVWEIQKRAARAEEERLTEAAKDNAKAVRLQAEEYANTTTKANILADRYNYLAAKTKLTKEEQNEMSEIVKKLKDIYPDLNLQVDEHGRLLDTSRESINDFRIAKEKETLALLDNAGALLKEQIARKQGRVDVIKYDPRAMKNSDNIKFVEREEKAIKELTEQYNKNNQAQNNILQTMRARAELKSRGTLGEETTEETKTVNAQTEANNLQSESVKEKTKTYKEYRKELEESIKKHDLSIKQQKELNIAVDDNKAFEDRNNIIKNAVIEMTENLTLSKKQISELSAKYGSVFDDIDTDKFGKITGEIDKEIKEYEKSVLALKALGIEIKDEDIALQKANIAKSGVERLSRELDLTEAELNKVNELYGKLINYQAKADFKTLQEDIDKNIEKYNKQIEVEKKLGRTITESQEEAGKSEIVREGIDKIINSLELTEEQIEVLKEKFGDLYSFSKKESTDAASAFREDWSQVLGFGLSSTTSMIASSIEAMNASKNRQIDLIEEKKSVALKAVEAEKEAYLEANNAIEKSEADRLKDSIKDIKARQNVALGLYEQERLKKQLLDEEAELARLTAEEREAEKKKEIEKKFTNDKLKLEYDTRVQEYNMSIVSAIATQAQAILNAVMAGSKFGPLGILAYSAAAGTAAGIQMGALMKAKPVEPKYLERGGLVKKTPGGVDAVIGEGNYDEIVAPLSDDVFKRFAKGISKEQQTEKSEITETKEITTTQTEQPIFITLNGKVLGEYILNLTSRGVKIVSSRGVF